MLVDEDGNPILQDGVQVVTYGLKTNKKSVIKQQASGLTCTNRLVCH
jgi:hypothetical protein